MKLISLGLDNGFLVPEPNSEKISDQFGFYIKNSGFGLPEPKIKKLGLGSNIVFKPKIPIGYPIN